MFDTKVYIIIYFVKKLDLKYFIMVIPTIMAIGSGLASIYGAIQGNINRKKAEELYDKQFQEAKEYRDREMAGDYLQRADSQAILRRVEENNQEYLDAMNNDAIRSGATAEAKVAAARKAQDAYADVAAELAAQGQQHKDAVDANYQQQKMQRDNMKIANLTDTSAIQNMVSGMGAAASAMGSIYANSGATPKEFTPLQKPQFNTTINLKPIGQY